MKDQKDLKSIKKGVNWIENQGIFVIQNALNLLNSTFW